MPQFYVPRKNIRGSFFVFNASESGHLVRVLRKKPGDLIQIFDGEGEVLTAKLVDCSDPGAVRGEILSGGEAPAHFSPSREVHLYPALIKSARFEWLLEKAAELGVRSIHPLVTERTVVRIEKDAESGKLERWNKVVLSAVKQCGSPRVPPVSAPVLFRDALSGLREQEAGLDLMLWEGESENHLSKVLREAGPSGPVRLFFGPEGGFTVEESRLATDFGLTPVRLGDSILRAETAVLAATSAVLFSF